MSTSAKLILLAQAMGTDVKLLNQHLGDLSQLPTEAKDSLVTALAELHTLVLAAEGNKIDDTAVAGATDVTWSVDKIVAMLAAAKSEAKSETKNELLDGAGAAYDTFKELQDLLVAENDAVAALTTAVGNRVRFDEAQALTDAQKATARTNIGAASAADVTAVSEDVAALVQSIGDADADLVAAYTAAKA